ncbi:methyltransferase domain-containing protein [Actinomadura sp. 6K520]|uniref:class I SAM-dependent methyltransferase n=1 Tax=Actinomadura sp. 6K520 TaxID=2530364 RepID=UPI0014052E20|nr:methyltransferase domain-containing protein [Actinomadura sp. 6K520]
MNRQDEVLNLLDVRPGERILEVGYGPGGLVRGLLRTSAGRVCGVDPSPEMRDMARKHGPKADLRVGTAEDTGFGDAEFDCVVSVNTVGLWQSLEKGLDESRRVTRQGGRVVIAWHGGRRPSKIARSLMLRDDQLARIEREMRGRFSEVTRRELSELTVFMGYRRS